MSTVRQSRSTLTALVAVGLGGLVAVALGVYGSVHQPTGRAISTFGFDSMIAMKVWLGLVVGALALGQLVGALWMYGKLGRPAPSWVGMGHRVSGLLAVLVSLPVAYHCLWSLGFASYDTRTLVHSIAGCLFYGAVVTKVLTLRGPATAGWALPMAGGALFTAAVVTVLISSVWYLNTVGVPSGAY